MKTLDLNFEKVNYITPIKKELDEHLHRISNEFMLIGMRRETPRYYNLKDYQERINNSYLIEIFSTQNENLGFKILTPIDYPLINFDEFWEQFKEYRTEFLFKNYPQIEQYGINLTKYKPNH
tara:strand:+ start:5618 stop:5983 length:366 start_codon:yes stop_codon:yes gene_type:complete